MIYLQPALAASTEATFMEVQLLRAGKIKFNNIGNYQL